MMALYKLVNGTQVQMSSEEEASVTTEWTANNLAKLEYEKNFGYQEQRKKLYPTVEDQLDMIYKDTINNTTLWSDLITSIKAQYPKPVEAPLK